MNSKSNIFNNTNPKLLEDLHQKFKNDPNSVPENWRFFFEGFELNGGDATSIPPPSSTAHASANSFSANNYGNYDSNHPESNVIKLIQAYRSRGHLIARLNPLADKNEELAELSLPYFGLSENDFDTVFNSGNELNIGPAKLSTIYAALKEIYASTFTIEFTHCEQTIRQWIYNTVEAKIANPNYSKDKKLNLFENLSNATIFEQFLQTKYSGVKRFGLEGGESIIPGLMTMIEKGVELGAQEFVFGMAHRGRLNVLANVLKKSYFNLFTEFEGGQLPEHIKGDGDVKYHLGQSTDIKVDNKDVHLSLCFNPSHLEAVNSIVTGIVKGKCKKNYENNTKKIIPVLIHGDSAVAGQGVVYEHANMSQLPGYRNGGSIHIVINNQVGFTANPTESRSSFHCTEVAKITASPIFHVNGDDVEKVSYAFELAMQIRDQFEIDVWIDVVCYRRRGHNEGDEPKFTQPLMYAKIEKQPTTYELYLKKLLNEKVIEQGKAEAIKNQIKDQLEKTSDEAKKTKSHLNVDTLKRYWHDIRPANDEDFSTTFDTKVDLEATDKLIKTLSTIPKDFNIFPKLKKIIEAREKLYFKDRKIDWAISEQLAFATLLSEGNSIRLTGQDSERATFGHRHCVMKDTKTESKYLPYDQVVKKPATFVVINSQLSEYSVLGYEYGFSLARPHCLVIWEAQFGDFANGAQIVIDQFISSGETKWQRHSGLVMYLPHGYEGMGPEHSSARLERFLQLCARNNMYVVNITEPANLFHALRRQLRAPFRKPLIIMTPKSLLRHPLCVSPVSRLTEGLKEVIDDDKAKPDKTKRVILCTGKIYYELLEKREEDKKNDIAIVRLEQIYPLQKNKLDAIRKKYSKAKEWLWVQEEPVNMGAWTFISHRLSYYGLQCIARNTSSSPASGVTAVHKKNQIKIVNLAINEKIEKLKKYY